MFHDYSVTLEGLELGEYGVDIDVVAKYEIEPYDPGNHLDPPSGGYACFQDAKIIKVEAIDADGNKVAITPAQRAYLQTIVDKRMGDRDTEDEAYEDYCERDESPFSYWR